jgi:hypothetical protein
MNEELPLFPTMLPLVPFSIKNTLPRTAGIYFALHITGKVLYVGATRNLHQRWNTYHHRSGELQEMGCTSVAYYLCGIDVLAEIECTMIQRFSPPLNKQRRYRLRPPAKPVGSLRRKTPPPYKLQTLRLPLEVFEAVCEIAAEEMRPWNGQALMLIREALRERKKKAQQIPCDT